ncbi:hypothetical protein [uncultured Hyphomicrobium sp.]|uniref:hypothetical protein n=1 Tax=uncultured Hyphomicrobium sp. TaxID=194373 RepID=UPI0025D186A6|nr:hypothetical protein [uncultured Hyphomicrobium sp.]
MRIPFGAKSRKFLFLFLIGFSVFPLAVAQSEPPAATTDAAAQAGISPGDGALSGFSGVELSGGSVARGVNPIDKTVISIANPSLKILDLSHIEGEPVGQLLPPKIKFSVAAKDIGQVFGLAFDEGAADSPPDVFAASTSAYGLYIVADKPGPDGKPVRLKAGAPGAKFMDGQFGPGATPGAIWKIDGATGAVSLFAETVEGSSGNSGAALGDIAVDPASGSLFASDLDTGLIHRFPLEAGGKSGATFDHGAAGRVAAGLAAVADDKKRLDVTSPAFKPNDPKTWGITPSERRIDGLAVRDGRLYYAVAAGPEIWSVGIGADGVFGSDARREISVKSERPAVVSDIVFDADGRMTVALRGETKSPYDYRKLIEPETGAVLRYLPDAAGGATRWKAEPEIYGIGSANGKSSASGGVTLGYPYESNGTIKLAACSGSVAATGDALPADDDVVNGAQIMSADLVRPADAPAKSVFVDFDPMQNSKELTGHIGDIEIFQRCGGAEAPAAAVAEGGAGGGFGGGSPGESGFFDEQQVEEGLAAGEDAPVEEGVDPNAPNVAVKKERQCSVSGATGQCTFTISLINDRAVPFNMIGATITDAFSGATPTTNLPANGGAQATANGFTVPINRSAIIQPGATIPSRAVTMSFAVPPGGVTVENCASVSFADPAVPLPAAAPTAPQNTAPVPGTSVKSDTRKCAEPDPNTGLKDCTIDVTVRNDNDANTNTGVRLTVTSPAKVDSASAGSGTNTTVVGENRVFINGGGINGKTESTVPVRLTLPRDADINAVKIDTAIPTDAEALAVIPKSEDDEKLIAAAGAPAAQNQGGATQTASADSDPSDNQSCVTFDTNKPDDPGTPTNTPTLPQTPNPAPATPGANPSAGGGTPPPVQPVELAKRAVGACSPDGDCEFEIAVTNTTGKDMKGPIALDEMVAGLGPSGTPQPTLAGPVNAPWTCTPGEKTMACSHPGPLRAGQTEILRAKFKVPPSDQGTGVANCVNLSGIPEGITPEVANQVRPTASSKDGVAVFAKPRSDTCSPSGECVWDITVTNTTNAPMSGPLEFENSVDGFDGTTANVGPDSRVIASKAVSGEGLVCNKPLEPSVCNVPNVTIEPGQSLNFSIATTPSLPGDKAATTLMQSIRARIGDTQGARLSGTFDTVVALDPPVPSPDGTAPTGPGAKDILALPQRKCTLARVPAPPKLVIDKSGPEHCPVHGICKFKIDITNQGEAAFQGTVSITDFLPGQAVSTPSGVISAEAESMHLSADSTGGNWGCRSAPSQKNLLECDLKNAFIPAGQSVSLVVDVTAGDTWKNAQTNELENCANLSAEGTAPPSRHSGKDCATARLDPFDVQVAKTGGQSCQPGKECKFNLDIFNPGNIPHDDPVIVTDKMSGLGTAQIVSLTKVGNADDFPCTPPPTQAPFTCTGHMRLEVGEHNNYEVVIRIPDDAPTTGAFTNCASVGPKGGTQPEAVSADKGATPAGGSCHTTTLEPAAPETCPEGWTGIHPNCVPPEQMTGGPSMTEQPDPLTGGTNDTASTLSCPDGWTGTHPDCIPPPTGGPSMAAQPDQLTGGMNGTVQDDQCFGGMILVASSNECRCPAPTVLSSATGTCVDPPTRDEDEEALTGGMNMTAQDPETTATPVRVPDVRPCPGDLVGTRPYCRCPDGTRRISKTQCGPVVIIKDPPRYPCPGNQLGTRPNCYCPAGLKMTKTACVRTQSPPPTPKPPVRCRGNQIGQPPACFCPPGTKEIRPNYCARVKEPKPPKVAKCKGKQIGTPPNCYCANGGSGSNCVKAVKPPPPKPVAPPPKPAPPPCPAGLVGTPPNCHKPVKAVGKKKKDPDKRINYGSSSNDKPVFQEPE